MFVIIFCDDSFLNVVGFFYILHGIASCRTWNITNLKSYGWKHRKGSLEILNML